MVEMLAEAEHQSTHWRERCLAGVTFARPRVEDFDGLGASGTVDLRAALLELDELLPRERLVVTDTGRFIYPTWRYLDVRNPLDFVHTLNFASIGLGVATAVGVATGHPDRMTVVVAGDGGGMMGMGELTTAVREKLPLVVVIANDSAYGMEHRTLVKSGLDPRHSKLQWPSFAEVARGYGAEAHTVTSGSELRRALRGLPRVPSGPILLELRIDPDVDVGE
jgi:thiamine pyrophosphate-dependent acetolactate synthase large subunit-like protein